MEKFSPLRLTEAHFDKANIPLFYRRLSLGMRVVFAQSMSATYSSMRFRLYFAYCWLFFPLCLYAFLALNLVPEALWQQLYYSDNLFMRVMKQPFHALYTYSLEGQKLHPDKSFASYFLIPVVFFLFHFVLSIFITIPACRLLYKSKNEQLILSVAKHPDYQKYNDTDPIKPLFKSNLTYYRAMYLFILMMIFMCIGVLFGDNSDPSNFLDRLTIPSYNFSDVVVRVGFISLLFFIITGFIFSVLLSNKIDNLEVDKQV